MSEPEEIEELLLSRKRKKRRSRGPYRKASRVVRKRSRALLAFFHRL